jgi:hypothetical protein
MMQSKMTEKEARQATADAWLNSGGTICEPLWQAIKAALGLEFAPEPVKLPERLAIRPDLAVSKSCPAIAPPEIFFENEAQRDAAYAAAVDRYNAYPGLRAAAEGLCRRLRECYSGQCNTQGHLGRVEAELAKGPK